MKGDDRSRLDIIEGKVDILLDRSKRWEKDIYDHEIRVRAIEVFTQDAQAYRNAQGDHEDRLRKLEKWKYAIPASILMAAAAFFGAIAGK